MTEPLTTNIIFEQFLHYLGILFLGGIVFVKSSLTVWIAR